MGLPVVALPTDTVLIGDDKVEIRGLSRAETLRLSGLEIDDADNLVLSIGAGVSEDEARAWRNTTSNEVVRKLVDRIVELSGLTEDSQGK